MKKLLTLAITVLLTLNCVAAESEIWQSNIEDAMLQAQKENKDILIDFTGSDWCGWCIKLDKEVFSKPEFQKEVTKSFVLVKLDFPRHNRQTAEQKKYNQEQAKKYAVSGYPTIILTDKNGEKYGKTGYQEGGPERYLKNLAKIKKVAARKAAIDQGEKSKKEELRVPVKPTMTNPKVKPTKAEADASAKPTKVEAEVSAKPTKAAAEVSAKPTKVEAEVSAKPTKVEAEVSATKADIWKTNVEEAMLQAKKEGKDILIDFTGSDWCGWCVKLDNEVFSKPEFQKEVTNSFVLVKLDFPNKIKQTPEQKLYNQNQAKKFAIRGYPTIIITDASGKKYAQTGYKAGGPEVYLKHLAELQKDKDKK